MKIKTVHLTGFKRFTELWIEEIPESARLVVLVGPNGSGKSCVFDAFNLFLTRSKGSVLFFEDYHVKSSAALPFSIKDWNALMRNVSVEFHDFAASDLNSWGKTSESHKKAFYIRSSHRHEADFVIQALERHGDVLDDAKRPQTLISSDTRVSDNYQRLVARTVEAIYDKTDDTQTKKEIRERLIKSVAESLCRVFGDLEFVGPGNPLEQGTFYFNKGDTENWKYKNLSGGEKAAFDLLLDFIVKAEIFDNTVFCIDEPEMHMHTRTQSLLLQELLEKLPTKNQLWIATHSVGSVRKAKELAAAKPGEVVFLDFDNQKFDRVVHIKPAVTNRAFWKGTFAVAIGDLAELIAPTTIVCCEGAMTRNGEFDAKCFRQIFEIEFPDVDFVSLGGASQVEKNSAVISSVFDTVLSGVKLTKVIDRDDRAQGEVDNLKRQGTRVLSLRHLENYLYDDEILKKLCEVTGQPEKINDVLASKASALCSSIARGNPSDDYKSMSGDCYVAVKRLLNLTQCGSTSEAFCLETLAPLITPDTAIYKKLKSDIFA